MALKPNTTYRDHAGKLWICEKVSHMGAVVRPAKKTTVVIDGKPPFHAKGKPTVISAEAPWTEVD